MADKNKGNFRYADSDEPSTESETGAGGEVADEKDVDNTEAAGLKNVPRAGSSSDVPSGVSFNSGSGLDS